MATTERSPEALIREATFLRNRLLHKAELERARSRVHIPLMFTDSVEMIDRLVALVEQQAAELNLAELHAIPAPDPLRHATWCNASANAYVGQSDSGCSCPPSWQIRGLRAALLAQGDQTP